MSNCIMTKCMNKTCLISVIATSLFLMGYGFVVHEILLKADYMATADMWRTPEEMQTFFPWCMLFPVGIAMVLTCLFKKFKAGCAAKCPDAAASCCPIKSGGLCFGMKIGLLFGLLMAQSYIWMPIPLDLAVKWFFAGLGQGVGAGIVLGMVCQTTNTTSCDSSGAGSEK